MCVPAAATATAKCLEPCGFQYSSFCRTPPGFWGKECVRRKAHRRAERVSRPRTNAACGLSNKRGSLECHTEILNQIFQSSQDRHQVVIRRSRHHSRPPQRFQAKAYSQRALASHIYLCCQVLAYDTICDRSATTADCRDCAGRRTLPAHTLCALHVLDRNGAWGAGPTDTPEANAAMVTGFLQLAKVSAANGTRRCILPSLFVHADGAASDARRGRAAAIFNA